MLKNQVITFTDAIFISLSGMAIVLMVLILIALFVVLLSKVIGSIVKEEPALTKPAAASPTPVTVPVAVPEAHGDEIAAVMTVVIEESGHQPEEIVFKSITKK